MAVAAAVVALCQCTVPVHSGDSQAAVVAAEAVANAAPPPAALGVAVRAATHFLLPAQAAGHVELHHGCPGTYPFGSVCWQLIVRQHLKYDYLMSHAHAALATS